MRPAESKYSYIQRRRYKTRLRRRLKKNKTQAEAMLLSVVRGMGVSYMFQKIIRGYIVDFYFHGGRLAVELDGDSHIGKEQYDADRTEHIAKEGIEVIRFRNEEVVKDVASVWRQIWKRCKQRRAELGITGRL